MGENVNSADFNFDALVELCRRTNEELRNRAIRFSPLNWRTVSGELLRTKEVLKAQLEKIGAELE